MGWYGGPDCGCCEKPCINCTAAGSPLSVTVALASAANSQCDTCANLNGSHIVPQNYAVNHCFYDKGNAPLGCTGYGVISSQYSIIARAIVHTPYHATNVVWFVRVIATVTTAVLYNTVAEYIWDSSGSSPMDCTVSRTPTQWNLYNTGVGHACDLSSMTMTLTPN